MGLEVREDGLENYLPQGWGRVSELLVQISKLPKLVSRLVSRFGVK